MDLGKQDTGSASVAGQGGGRIGQRARVNRVPPWQNSSPGAHREPPLFRGPHGVQSLICGVGRAEELSQKAPANSTSGSGAANVSGPRRPGSTSVSTPGWCSMSHG